MPANSFQNALCPDGKYAVPAGELHLFDEGDRNTEWDISVNPTTAFVEYDLSGRVPRGTKALYGWIAFVNASNASVIEVRDGNSTETDAEKVRAFNFGVADANYIGWPVIIKATDGIFDLKELGAGFAASAFTFELWGYYL